MDDLQIRLGEEDGAPDLKMLESMAEHLRGAMRELAREAGAVGKIEIRLRIRDMRKGSVILDLDPEILGENVPPTQEAVSRLIEDINALGQDRPRSTMSTPLLNQYRSLFNVAQKAGGLSLDYRDEATHIGPVNAVAFEAAMRESPEIGTVVQGYIESVNIHGTPWTFGLYTKLDRKRVECRFTEPMLDAVLEFMERKALVEVTGEGQFGAVGTTPRVIALAEPPREIVFNRKKLLSFIGAFTMGGPDETSVERVARLRQEAAIYG